MSLPPATSAPPLAPAGLRPRVRAAAGVLFLALLAVWTWKLLEPSPVPESLKLSLASVWDLLPFLAAKCLHAGGYALLTALAWVWAPTPQWKWAAVAFLLAHGVGTEIGQTFVPNRTGKVTDVLIDWAGITAGLLAVRRAIPARRR